MSDELIKSNKVYGPAGFPFVIIPWPQPIPRAYGIESTSGPYGTFIQYRGTKTELTIIQEAAALMGLTAGELMRRNNLAFAQYILANFKESEG